jgi:integrase
LPRHRTKNGRAHTIPLSETALGIVQNLTVTPGRDHIFGSGAGSFSGWSKSKKRLDTTLGEKIAPWVVHDLRRTFATVASDLNFAPPHVIEMALNHWSGSKSGIVATYNRAKYDRERRILMEGWAAHIEGLVHAAQA